MARTDLPREIARKPLGFEELISTLELIDGETVIVRFNARSPDDEPEAGLASIVGELRHRVPARYSGHEFSIGAPYPDRDPPHLAGGIIFLDKPTFEAATLTTFDGNDYFIVLITTRALEILLEGVDSTYP